MSEAASLIPLCTPDLVEGIRACVPLLNLFIPSLINGPLFSLATDPRGLSAVDWPLAVTQFHFVCEQAAALNLRPAD
jgi:hypothetical protein